MNNYAASLILMLFTFAVPILAQPISLPPQQESYRQLSWTLMKTGETLLAAHKFVDAEADFRTALTLWPENAAIDPDLAKALSAQGKNEEALDVYRRLVYQYPRNMNSVAEDTRTLMNFACLLSQTGNWPEAVSVYEKALPLVPDNKFLLSESAFDPQIPSVIGLQLRAHIACGLRYEGYGKSVEAFGEFRDAALLASGSAIANYYYGYGWQRLDQADRAKIANAQQAKAALQKAVRLGKGDVKKAAEKALRGA